MQTVGRLIRARRTELCLTLRQVAEMVPCAESYLSQIETERRDRPPSPEMLGRLERALRLDPGKLLGIALWQTAPLELRREVIGLRRDREIARQMARLVRRGDSGARGSCELRRLAAQVESARAGGGVDGQRGKGGAGIAMGIPAQVPVLGSMEAGDSIGAADPVVASRVVEEYVSVPGVEEADAFAARVVGDAMAPQYLEGDIVVFSPSAGVGQGSDCFVRLGRGGGTLFARVYFERGARGERVRLQPLNPAHAAREVARGEVAGLHAAVCVVRALAPSRGPAGGRG